MAAKTEKATKSTKTTEDEQEFYVPPKEQQSENTRAFDLKLPAIISLFGAPKSGKSYLARFLITFILKKYQRENGGRLAVNCTIFTTTYFNEFYSSFLPEEWVVPVYHEENLEQIMDYQVDALETERRKKGNEDLKVPPKPFLIVLDDVLGSVNFKTPVWERMAASYRHYNITIIIASQAPQKLPVILRDWTSYAFIFNPRTDQVLEHLWKGYGASHRNPREYRKFFNEMLTGEHDVLLYDAIEGEENVFCAPEWKGGRIVVSSGKKGEKGERTKKKVRDAEA